MREIQIPLDALDNLHSFITSQQLKRATLTYIASKVPEEEIEPLRDAFLKLDINGDGTITREELESGLLSIGKFIDNKIMNQLVQVLDSNKNGILDYTEFIAACMNSQNYVDEVRIKECFVNMDKDKSGKLSVEELKQFFQAGDIISDIQQIENIIAEVDIDKDGQISYGEFLMMMRKT